MCKEISAEHAYCGEGGRGVKSVNTVISTKIGKSWVVQTPPPSSTYSGAAPGPNNTFLPTPLPRCLDFFTNNFASIYLPPIRRRTNIRG